MGKEAKVGLTIIGMLLLVLAGVVTMRLTRNDEPSLADVQPPTQDDQASPATFANGTGSSSLMNKMSDPSARNGAANVWDREPDPKTIVTTASAATPAKSNDRYASRYDRYPATPDKKAVPATGGAVDPFSPAAVQTAATSELPESKTPTEPRGLSRSPSEVQLAPSPTMPTLSVGGSSSTPATSSNITPPPSSRYGNDRYSATPASNTAPATTTTSTSTTNDNLGTSISSAPPQPLNAPSTSSSTLSSPTTSPASSLTATPSTLNSPNVSSPRSLPTTPPTNNVPPTHSTPTPTTLSTSTSTSAPTATPAAASGVEHAHVVGPRENNFWTIAQNAYGNGMYYQALEELNKPRLSDTKYLPPNTVVSVPPVEELRRRFPSLVPATSQPTTTANATLSTPEVATSNTPNVPEGGRLYRVQAGDTLFDIARKELGKPGRWAEIYDLNRDTLGQNFDALPPGTQLVLPGDSAPIATAPNFTR